MATLQDQFLQVLTILHQYVDVSNAQSDIEKDESPELTEHRRNLSQACETFQQICAQPGPSSITLENLTKFPMLRLLVNIEPATPTITVIRNTLNNMVLEDAMDSLNEIFNLLPQIYEPYAEKDTQISQLRLASVIKETAQNLLDLYDLSLALAKPYGASDEIKKMEAICDDLAETLRAAETFVTVASRYEVGEELKALYANGVFAKLADLRGRSDVHMAVDKILESPGDVDDENLQTWMESLVSEEDSMLRQDMTQQYRNFHPQTLKKLDAKVPWLTRDLRECSNEHATEPARLGFAAMSASTLEEPSALESVSQAVVKAWEGVHADVSFLPASEASARERYNQALRVARDSKTRIHLTHLRDHLAKWQAENPTHALNLEPSELAQPYEVPSEDQRTDNDQIAQRAFEVAKAALLEIFHRRALGEMAAEESEDGEHSMGYDSGQDSEGYDSSDENMDLS